MNEITIKKLTERGLGRMAPSEIEVRVKDRLKKVLEEYMDTESEFAEGEIETLQWVLKLLNGDIK